MYCKLLIESITVYAYFVIICANVGKFIWSQPHPLQICLSSVKFCKNNVHIENIEGRKVHETYVLTRDDHRKERVSHSDNRTKILKKE